MQGLVVETAKNAFYYFNNFKSVDFDSADDGKATGSDFLLADTEESDDESIDAELGYADYWECVKCKNKQNNPMYRFCEKCYQVSNREIYRFSVDCT